MHCFYFIASVKYRGESNAQYECVVAIERQETYGTLAIRALHRVLSVLSNPTNATIVKSELRLLEEKKWPKPKQMDTALDKMAQCPYTAFLLSDAIGSNLGDPIDPLPFDRGTWTSYLAPWCQGFLSQEGRVDAFSGPIELCLPSHIV